MSRTDDTRTPDPAAARAERLAAALRENLKRRKAQAKGRGAEEQAAAPPHVADGTPAVDSAAPEVAGEAGRVAAPSDKR